MRAAKVHTIDDVKANNFVVTALVDWTSKAKSRIFSGRPPSVWPGRNTASSSLLPALGDRSTMVSSTESG
jgi:hypothetical protein